MDGEKTMLQEVSSTRHLSWPGACGSAKRKTRVIKGLSSEMDQAESRLIR
jgi:hypothetical protein